MRAFFYWLEGEVAQPPQTRPPAPPGVEVEVCQPKPSQAIFMAFLVCTCAPNMKTN